jgi:folylpolyglutamate synthase
MRVWRRAALSKMLSGGAASLSVAPPVAPDGAAPTMEERLLALIHVAPPPTPPTRAEMVEFMRPRLECLGLLRHGTVDAALAPVVIHVAGTKGKGSTCALTESVLRAAGLRTGLFTSPHLVAVNERVRLQGRPVDDPTLRRHFEEVYTALAQRDLLPGYFCFLTLLGFHIMAAQALDVCVVEVGLGGRLDYTNVLEQPKATAVTLLDMDHMEFLGNTIELIAGEKAGIFKRGAPAVSSSKQEPAALAVLRARALEEGCSLSVAPPLPEGRELGISGDHQRDNAAIALALCDAAFPGRISRAAQDAGLRDCRWPGRCQVVEAGAVTYFLDGAHTYKSMQAALSWFVGEVRRRRAAAPPGHHEANLLLFNAMHPRNPLNLLEPVRELGCAGGAPAPSAPGAGGAAGAGGTAEQVVFDAVAITPGLFAKPSRVRMLSAAELIAEHQGRHAEPPQTPETWQETQGAVWRYLMGPHARTAVVTCRALSEAAELVEKYRVAATPVRVNVLVTGSLLLVGDFMKLSKIPVS